MSSVTEYWARTLRLSSTNATGQSVIVWFWYKWWPQFLLFLSPHTYSQLTKRRVEENEGQQTGGMMEPISVWAGLSSHYWTDNARREEGLKTRQNTMARVFIFYVRSSVLSAAVMSLSWFSPHLDLLCLPAQSSGRRQVCCCCCCW